MAEDLLDEADVRSAFEHESGHRMADETAGGVHADLIRFHPIADQSAETVWTGRLALSGKEESAAVRLGHKPRPRLVEILIQPCGGDGMSPTGITPSFFPYPLPLPTPSPSPSRDGHSASRPQSAKSDPKISIPEQSTVACARK